MNKTHKPYSELPAQTESFINTMKKTHKPHSLVNPFEWKTDDLFIQYKNSTSYNDIKSITCSVHDFLDYCLLLKELKESFCKQQTFNYYFTFLCGGYFAFAIFNELQLFPNIYDPLTPKPFIYGSLKNLENKINFKNDIINIISSNTNNKDINLFILDEVRSGTQMNTTLNAIEDITTYNPNINNCHLNITFFAIGPDAPQNMSKQLKDSINRWEGKTKRKKRANKKQNTTNNMNVSIKYFGGTLLPYDKDIIRGMLGKKSINHYYVLKKMVCSFELKCDNKNIYKDTCPDYKDTCPDYKDTCPDSVPCQYDSICLSTNTHNCQCFNTDCINGKQSIRVSFAARFSHLATDMLNEKNLQTRQFIIQRIRENGCTECNNKLKKLLGNNYISPNSKPSPKRKLK